MVAIEANLGKNKEFTLMSGFLMLLLGALIVAGHSVWVWNWQLIITLIGWILLVKGAMRIFSPSTNQHFLETKEKNHGFIWGEVAFLLMSLYLLYVSFLA